MMLSPGKKMTFMGCEFGEKNEWNEKRTLDWFLVECEGNSKLKKYVKAINHFYLKSSALWENDFSWRGFKWLAPLETESDIMSFSRISSDGELIAVFNFAENEERTMVLNEPLELIIDSDGEVFFGKGRCRLFDGELHIPPLSAAILAKKIPFFEKALDYSSDV